MEKQNECTQGYQDSKLVEHSIYKVKLSITHWHEIPRSATTTPLQVVAVALKEALDSKRSQKRDKLPIHLKLLFISLTFLCTALAQHL